MSKFTCLLLCFYVSSSWAIVPPEIAWKTLTTDHFEIIYEDNSRAMAEEIGRSAERAHALLTPIFKPPTDRTVIWIYDHTDAPNGMATPIPQNLIILYPVLPGPLDSIGHYDRWSHMLVTHEYTHILNMEPALGFWGPVRTILGSFVRPNALLPNWYLEGLAVESETQFTKFGRLRSPSWNGLIRAMVLDDRWFAEGLGLMNEVMVPTWPYGLRPYFWGGLMMHDISLRKNFDQFGYLNERYAARVPFFLSGPVKDLLGINYQELLKDMRISYEKKAKEQIKQIAETDKADKNLTPTKHDELSFDITSPSLSPDGLKLAYVRNNEDHDALVMLITREKSDADFDFSKAKQIYKGTDISTLGWWPDSKSIVLDTMDTNALYDAFSDLWKIDIEDKSKKEQLTFRERAQEPQVDRDGHRIVFVRTTGGKTELGVVLRDNKINYVYAPPEFYRVSRPGFLNEEEIIFAERTPEGSEYLKVFNLQTKDARIVLKDFAPARNVSVVKDGILFVSDKSGIQNLYWSSKSLLTARPVTNSRTSISTGTYDHNKDRIIFAQLTGTGAYLHSQRMPVETFKLPKTPPLIAEPAYKWSEPTLRTQMEHGEYSPIDYMFPKYWLPLFGVVPDGFLVSVLTGARDPLGKHAYSVAGNYDSLSGKVGGDGRYDMQAGDGVASLQGGVDYRYYYAYAVTAENTYVDLSYGVFPTRKNKNWILGVRASEGTTDVPGRRYEYAGPGAFVSYNDVSQKVTEISPSSGISALLDYQNFIGGLGNVNFQKTRANFTYYESRIFPKRHTLALSADGYFSPRNRSVFLGTSSGGNYSLTYLTAKSYITRGYPVGEFLGWNMGAGTLEYRFPVIDKPSELGTFPTLFRRWHGAVFLDAVTLEGYYFSREINGAKPTEMGNMYYGTGVELRTDITLAYHLPAMFRFGLFWGINHEAYGGVMPFVSMSVPEF